MKNIIVSAGLLLCAISSVKAQETNEKDKKFTIEYEAKVGFQIGGTSPLPLPREIRKIENYDPTFAVPVEGTVTFWSEKSPKWGVTTGLKLGNEGMITEAKVKSYRTEISQGAGEKIAGYWTGSVQTKVRNLQLSLPIMVAYRPHKDWNIRFGGYVSNLIRGEFSGKVYDGYLREHTPTGQKVEIRDGNSSTYDFSQNLRKINYGARAGVSYRAFNSFNAFADLSWGLSNVFKKDFKTISFNMYPIYANVGVGYVF